MYEMNDIKDIIALVITVLGALAFLAGIAGGLYVLVKVLRDAQKKDKAFEEFKKRFGG